MMLTTSEGEVHTLAEEGNQLGQYYTSEIVNYDCGEEEIVFDDPGEPCNYFCVNFVDDTLEIDTIGVFSQSHETTMDNHPTQETMPEVDKDSSKGAVGELKSDDTKPTEQKVTGEHLMTNTEDSLRTNVDTEASIKSGHENTEGPLNCKVNTIRQADENSEPLFSEKPVQETGSEHKTRGNTCQEGSTKTRTNDEEQVDKDKRRSGKQLTWLQKMWAEVPEGESKDWVKSVYTQETDWGDQGEMMWKQIVKD